MIRVLVVDDHAIVRRGLADLIRTAADLEVAGTAEDGARAIALAAELEPDVVLMDLSMPGVDGVAATAQILAARPEINVLVLTSLGDQQSIKGALEAGARGYLLKHSEPEAILAAIQAEGMPSGVFQLVQSNTNAAGEALVKHPLIRAVGFTGSLGAGRALYNLACARPEP